MGDDFFKPEYLLALPAYIAVILGAIFLHEMGHYAAARIFGISIKDVVIGRGKMLKSWTSSRNIEWRLHLLPFGAHVHLDDLETRPFYQKMITIIAGPSINIAVLPFLFLVFYITVGQPSIPNTIVGVEEGLPADLAGIEPGDRFIAVDGIPLTNFDDIWHFAYEKGAVESLYTIKRGDEVFDVAIKPGWSEYNDLSGVPRENARFGVTWQHAAFALKSIIAVNGIDTEDDPDLARESLIESFDQSAVIEIEGPKDQLKPMRIKLRGEINQGLLDEDNDFYDIVFLGETKGNIYMQKSIPEDIQNAFRYAGKLIKRIAGVPFQIFPIDKSIMKDPAAVSNPDTKIVNGIYRIMHLFAVASVVIGLMNLLPFPNLDGGQLLDQIVRKIAGGTVSNKVRANIYVTIFLLLYASIFIANMDNFYGYIDSRLKKVHEFIDDHNIKKKTDEDHDG